MRKVLNRIEGIMFWAFVGGLAFHGVAVVLRSGQDIGLVLIGLALVLVELAGWKKI